MKKVEPKKVKAAPKEVVKVEPNVCKPNPIVK